MVEWLLLDGVHTKAAGAPIGRQHELAADVRPDEAQALLSVTHLAFTRTNIALHPAVIKPMPMPSRQVADRSFHTAYNTLKTSEHRLRQWERTARRE